MDFEEVRERFGFKRWHGDFPIREFLLKLGEEEDFEYLGNEGNKFNYRLGEDKFSITEEKKGRWIVLTLYWNGEEVEEEYVKP